MWEGPPAMPSPLKEGPRTLHRAVAGGGAVPTTSRYRRRRGRAPASRSYQKGMRPRLWKWRGREREGEGEGGQSGEGEGGRSGETERGALGLDLAKGEAARWEREACGETERVREESRNPKGSVFILNTLLGLAWACLGRDINRGRAF